MQRFTRQYSVFAVVAVFGALVAGAGVHDARGVTWSSDFDGDSDVDLADFSTFAACFNGPNRLPVYPSCESPDLDVDGDVDLADFGIFAACFNGPNRVPACQPDPPIGMVLIPAGEFQMGDTFGEGEPRETPVHAVYVDAFYIDATEVTKGLWDEVRLWATESGYDLAGIGLGKASNHPVQTVSWYDCVKWCNARSQKEGRTPFYYTDAGFTVIYKTGELAPFMRWEANGFRLPTEAEWEKAARGGLDDYRFPWGNTINHDYANYRACGYCYPYDTSPYWNYTYHPDYDDVRPYTSPVGSFPPNGYGLYDVTANVWEWCNDWIDAAYYSVGPYPHVNPRGPTTGTYRTIRGSCWGYYAYICRIAYRYSYWANGRYDDLGCRCVVGSP
ncbi:MAG: formylglycine-generating enzyme family protein [Phycisphaerae bacterium]|nr:formylglycine-generating enzyme family protein [Phycisphaerae bacterium]